MSNKIDKFDIAFKGNLKSFCPDIDVAVIDGREILSILNDYSDEKWQRQKFLNFVWNNIALTALSQEERDKLVDSSYTATIAAAKKLRLLDRTNGDQDGDSDESDHSIPGQADHPFRGKLTRVFRAKVTTVIV